MSQLSRLIPTSGPGSGTVTSITFSGGLTSTPDPVTTTGTATIDQTNLTVLDGTVYWDTGTQLLHTTATGAAGQILTSNGAGMAPSYQSPAASSISITGDSGGAQTGNAFTFTGGTTGLTFAGAADTLTLGGTLAVIHGGTGDVSFTSNGVIYGNSTSALGVTAAGTTGQVLTGSTGNPPVWASPAASSITITGDSGGALTGNSFTFTGGTTGLTFAGAGTTETLGGTLVVSNGGTGRATLTNHGLLVGAGTAAITQLADATNGQLPIGSTGADPVLATLTPGTGISISNGAGTITISATGTTTLTYVSVNHAASPYTVLAADDYISADVTAGVVTILLPNAPATGRVFIVKDKVGLAATSNVTVTTVGGAVTIDGATSFVMNTAYESINVIFNGVSYEVF